METIIPLCTYIHDDGRSCRSAAVRGRNFCLFHLRHRGNLMRMAQAGAANREFELALPALDDLAAVQSALQQVIHALAANRIDVGRARQLTSALRFYVENFKHKDTWHDSPYHSDEPISYDNFEAEFGLPKDLDLSLSPQTAFPPQAPQAVAATEQNEKESAAASPVPPGLADQAQHIINVSKGIPYTTEDIVRFGSPVTPFDVELMEVQRTQGHQAASKLQEQYERNERLRAHRRKSSADRERFATVAMQKNLQQAIEKYAAQKIAAAANNTNSEEAASTPKKSPSSAITDAHDLAKKDVLTPTGSIG